MFSCNTAAPGFSRLLIAELFEMPLQGLRVAALTRETLKRKREQDEPVLDTSPKKPAAKPGSVTLSHEYVVPKDYVLPSTLREEINGKLPLLALIQNLLAVLLPDIRVGGHSVLPR